MTLNPLIQNSSVSTEWASQNIWEIGPTTRLHIHFVIAIHDSIALSYSATATFITFRTVIKASWFISVVCSKIFAMKQIITKPSLLLVLVFLPKDGSQANSRSACLYFRRQSAPKVHYEFQVFFSEYRRWNTAQKRTADRFLWSKAAVSCVRGLSSIHAYCRKKRLS